MKRSLARSLLAALACLSSAAAQPIPITELGLLPGDRAIGPATHSQQEHAVARGGDIYLVAWSDYRGQSVGGSSQQSGGDVFGIRLRADGTSVDPFPFLIAGGMGLQNRPQVAWNGENWLVVYQSQDPVGLYFETQLRAVRVSPQGAVLDPTPILFPTSQFSPSSIGLTIAGNQGQWLITRCVYHGDGYGTFLAGQRIGGDGQLLDPTPLVLIDWVYGGTRLLATTEGYLAAGPDWTDSAIIKARRIGFDAQPLGNPFTVPSLNLATDGIDFYVTWIADYVNLVGSRLTRAGTLMTPAGTLIVSDFSSYNQTALAHDGAQWWFLWGAADRLRTVRIDSAGAVLDPGGGIMLPITIGGTISYAYAPVLVGRPGGGVHLFWYDMRVALGNDANVFVLPIGPDQTLEPERCISTGTRNQVAPDLAEGPDGDVALAFISEAANDDCVFVHLLDAGGRAKRAEPIEIYRGPTVGRVGLAWNGACYLAVWDAGASGLSATAIKYRRLSATGELLEPAPLDLMPGFSPDVEALGPNFYVASARFAAYPQYIFAQGIRIDGATGQLLDAGPRSLGGYYVSTGPRVHQDGTRWIVTYHSHWSHDSSQSDALYNFVNADGTITPARNPTPVAGGSGTPDVVFSGSRYLFVWRSNSLSSANNYISGRIMNPDGTFATGAFVISEAPGRQLRPVVGWDGTSFVVAWDDQRHQAAFFDARTDIYGARVSEDGVVLDPGGLEIYRGPQGDAAAALLALPTGRTLVASARFITSGDFDTYRIGLTVLGMPPAAPGDTNCDQRVDFDDIDSFVLAIVSAPAYHDAFPNCDMEAADANGDGTVDFDDIDAFVRLLIG